MERLTIKYDKFFVPKKTCTIDRLGEADDCDACLDVCGDDCGNCPIQECFEKLAEYEDTGLAPEQIKEIDELYSEKCKLVDQCREAQEKQYAKKPNYEGDGCDNEGNMIFDTWICPCCGKDYEVDYDKYDYCPNCGQHIDWGRD